MKRIIILLYILIFTCLTAIRFDIEIVSAAPLNISTNTTKAFRSTLRKPSPKSYCPASGITSPNKNDTNNADTGKIEIIQDSRIQALLDKHIAINKKQKGIPGYRVQIFFGSKRKDALEMKAEFLNKFPDINAYTKYDEPYFKVRVGDFRTQLKAQKFYKEISGDFHNAFIVQDLIILPFLNDN